MNELTTMRPEQFICEYIEELPTKILTPLFKVYTALIRMADYASNTLAVNHFPDFAFQLGYTRRELNVILHNLERLGLITVSMEDEHKGTITLREMQSK